MDDEIRLGGVPREVSLPEEHAQGRSQKRKPKPRPQATAPAEPDEIEDRYEPSGPPEDAA